MATCPECLAVYGDDVQTCPQHDCALVPDDLVRHDEDAIAPGTMIGEYVIQRKLGSGTFGDVYAGEHPLIGKRVAVKILNHRFASDPVMISRFVAEARAVNKIRQRNIIDIFSFGVLPGKERHYFVMELLDGLTLGELLDRRGRLPMATVLPIVRGIAEALDAVHEAGITHRDLKPDNVFLATERDGSYFPKLLDFGIAKLIDDKTAHKTGPGMVLGTPRYMSPEQARGKAADHRADVYALGVMIHEMLTGEAPFTGQSSVDVLLKHTAEPPPRLSEVCPDLPPELDAPVLSMLEKRPADRPATAGAAVAALVERAQRLGIDRVDAVPERVDDRPTMPAASDAVWSNPTVIEVKPTGRDTPDTPVGSPPPRRSPAPAAGDDANVTALAEGIRRSPGAAPLDAPERNSGPSTEELSVVETDSAITRSGMPLRRKVVLGVMGALAIGLSIWALGLLSQGQGPVNASPSLRESAVAPPVASAPVVSPSPSPSASASAAEPQIKPSDALPEVIEVRVTTHPSDAEIWLGERRLGTSASPVSVPRGSASIELRVKKIGYKDEALALTPDHDQPLDVTLLPSGGRRESSAPVKPPKGTGKLDRILGDRE